LETRIIAVRHGETEWNKKRLLQGHRDSLLTGLGVKQAEAAGKGLCNIRIDSFYSSDLGRAAQTAEIISSIIGIGFSTDKRLRERALGMFEGFSRDDVKSRYPDDAELYESRKNDYRIPGGESIDDLSARTVSYAEEIASSNTKKTVLFVTHGGVLECFLAKTLRIPMRKDRSYSLYNASINSFTITDNFKWKLEYWGDINHLRALKVDSTNFESSN
jgi:probable phosphoglycerate mutase